mgnify:FL=1|jgi:hypothetical protein
MSTNNSEVSFSAVEAATGAPDTLRSYIRAVFKHDEDKAFKEARPHLMPPGVEGNTAWDHKAVVDILLKHDTKCGNSIAAYMVSNNLSKAMLWPEVVKVLRKAGFEMSRGRVVGVIEHKKPEAE